MSTLIKSILNTEQIQELKPDFSVLKIIKKEDAARDQVLIFNKEGKRTLEILTTNNYVEKVNTLIEKLESKGYHSKVFYTSTEGFNQWMLRYEQMNTANFLLEEQKKESQEAEGKFALSIMKELFDKREQEDPWEFIKNIIRLWFQTWASDLHFQPEESGIELRLRVDGVLHNIFKFSHQEFWKYMQKIKFISGVKMNVSHIPQDGRFSFEASDRSWKLKKIDARVSFMPGIQTESVVIRFLDASKSIDSFKDIGFPDYHIKTLESYIRKTSGIIVITGPTGSGKTTTLYTILKQLNDGSKKIITLEDPIEYKIAGIQQSQINYNKGYDYEIWLKGILRQDPDIILVGETRTKETAQIAINASLTGHLVFTTLHTNSVLDSLARLLNMGIEPYLLMPALHLLVGQRLVRKICTHCWVWEDAHPEEDQEIRSKLMEIQKTDPELGKNYQGKVLRGKWCEHCNQTGYLWRVAILEVLEINDQLKEKLMKETIGENLLPLAKSFGFIPMQEDGILKVIEGITDLNELHRVLF